MIEERTEGYKQSDVRNGGMLGWGSKPWRALNINVRELWLVMGVHWEPEEGNEERCPIV